MYKAPNSQTMYIISHTAPILTTFQSISNMETTNSLPCQTVAITTEDPEFPTPDVEKLPKQNKPNQTKQIPSNPTKAQMKKTQQQHKNFFSALSNLEITNA